jgi:hypothetical protein
MGKTSNSTTAASAAGAAKKPKPIPVQTTNKNATKNKDYAYRGMWKHKYSRARNKEQRGGLSKADMMRLKGGFPKKKDWWGTDTSENEWATKWIKENPKY